MLLLTLSLSCYKTDTCAALPCSTPLIHDAQHHNMKGQERVLPSCITGTSGCQPRSGQVLWMSRTCGHNSRHNAKIRLGILSIDVIALPWTVCHDSKRPAHRPAHRSRYQLAQLHGTAVTHFVPSRSFSTFFFNGENSVWWYTLDHSKVALTALCHLQSLIMHTVPEAASQQVLHLCCYPPAHHVALLVQKELGEVPLLMCQGGVRGLKQGARGAGRGGVQHRVGD